MQTRSCCAGHSYEAFIRDGSNQINNVQLEGRGGAGILLLFSFSRAEREKEERREVFLLLNEVEGYYGRREKERNRTKNVVCSVVHDMGGSKCLRNSNESKQGVSGLWAYPLEYEGNSRYTSISSP